MTVLRWPLLLICWLFKAVCKLGLEGIVSKRLDSPYWSGPSKAWLKIKNPKAPAATRAINGTF
jgi:bifunctional non-homologous end joining protein LigD